MKIKDIVFGLKLQSNVLISILWFNENYELLVIIFILRFYMRCLG